MDRTLAKAFADHLQLLLDFHRDDDVEGQGQFFDPVRSLNPSISDDAALLVTLTSGQKLRVLVLPVLVEIN